MASITTTAPQLAEPAPTRCCSRCGGLVAYRPAEPKRLVHVDDAGRYVYRPHRPSS